MNRLDTDILQRASRPTRTAATIALALALATVAAPGAQAGGHTVVPVHVEPPSSAASVEAATGAPLLSDHVHRIVEDAMRYEEGDGVARDLARAYALYCEAARSESPEALMRMGWMFANGRGRPLNESIARTLFRRAAGAPLGYDDLMPDCLRPPYRIVEYREPEPKRETAPKGAADLVAFQRPAEFFAANPAAGRNRLMRTAVTMASEFELDPRLVLAVIQAESNFDPQAVSPKNAQGLMQLIPETAERFAVRDAFNPVQNLRGGMRYLRWLLSYFRGDVKLALAGYNAGEGAVDRYRGVPPYAETRAYVRRIQALFPYDTHPFDASLAAPAAWVFERFSVPSRPSDTRFLPDARSRLPAQATRRPASSPSHTEVSLRDGDAALAR